jgi:hypothetical protein
VSATEFQLRRGNNSEVDSDKPVSGDLLWSRIANLISMSDLPRLWATYTVGIIVIQSDWQPV